MLFEEAWEELRSRQLLVDAKADTSLQLALGALI